MHRFFLPPPEWNSRTPALPPGEAHHALDVLRLGPDSRLVVFDGQGGEASAQVTGTAGGTVQLKLLEKVLAPPLPCAITLAQAVPKGKTMDLIVQKAVELGASRVAPLLSDRTVVRLEPAEAAKKRERWQDIALEACKQCGQNRLPEISPPIGVRNFLEGPERFDLMLIASLQPDARKIKEVLAANALPRTACILVGPEGDFTPAELALARSHGCLPVTLGPIILRAETAAIYSLSVLAHELFDR